jgi:hypothetical protein
VAAVVVLVAVVAAALVLGPTQPEDGPRADDTPGPTSDALVETVPAPEGLAGTAGPDGVSFTWTNPDPQPGDKFLWRRSDPGAAGELAPVDAPPVTVEGADGRVCVEVLLRRANGRVSAQPAQACAP